VSGELNLFPNFTGIFLIITDCLINLREEEFSWVRFEEAGTNIIVLFTNR